MYILIGSVWVQDVDLHGSRHAEHHLIFMKTMSYWEQRVRIWKTKRPSSKVSDKTRHIH